MIKLKNQLHRCTAFNRKLSVVAALLLAIGFAAAPASASQPNLPPSGNFTGIAAAPGGGYWIQLDVPGIVGEFKTLAIGGAPEFESVNMPGSIAAIPGRNGYWVVGVNGEIHARGDAPEICGGHLRNCTGFRPSEGRITAAAASPNGEGLWAVDERRYVWAAGNVVSYGDVRGDNQTPTGIAVTPSGEGYYIVMNDGGVFTFGDAIFYGSTGGKKPGGHDVTGIALSHTILGGVNGYWLVAEDGGVFSYGDAIFLGSTGGGPGKGAVSNIVTQRDGRSYAWVYAGGKVEYSREAPPVVIKSVSHGTVISAPADNDAAGAVVKLEAPDGSDRQQWKVLRTTPYAVQLANVRNGMCLDLEGAKLQGRVIQHPCKADPNDWGNQLWRPQKDVGQRVGAIRFDLVKPVGTLTGFSEREGGQLQVLPISSGLGDFTVTLVL